MRWYRGHRPSGEAMNTLVLDGRDEHVARQSTRRGGPTIVGIGRDGRALKPTGRRRKFQETLSPSPTSTHERGVRSERCRPITAVDFFPRADSETSRAKGWCQTRTDYFCFAKTRNPVNENALDGLQQRAICFADRRVKIPRKNRHATHFQETSQHAERAPVQPPPHPGREAEELWPHVGRHRLEALSVKALGERRLGLYQTPQQVGRRGGAERSKVFLRHVELPLCSCGRM